MTGKRILIVEDQEELRGVLRDLLTGSGTRCSKRQTGRRASQRKSDRPDLILMDVQMPVLDGYEATRQIKADPTLKAHHCCQLVRDEGRRGEGAGCGLR